MAGVARRVPASVRRPAQRVRLWWQRYAPVDADVAIASFPKAGRTWLRLMVGEAIDRHFDLQADDRHKLYLERLAGRAPGIPRIKVTHDLSFVPKVTNRWLWRRRYRRTRVILLVRDPRDTLVSYYFHAAKRRGWTSREMSGWLRSGAADQLARYYDQWAAYRDVPTAMLLVRYEDISRDPAAVLAQVLSFMGLQDVSDDTIAAAVEAVSFDRMREKEVADVFRSEKMRATDPLDPESFKTRRGKVGGFTDYLTADDLTYIASRFASWDRWYGYGADWA